MTRSSTATWKGSGIEGTGTITTESKVLTDIPYNFKDRFSSEIQGTNPEELLASAHASCFSMKLSFVLVEAGFVPIAIQTTARIKFENAKITASHLDVTSMIPGISDELFRNSIAEAMQRCPVSMALNATITFDAMLLESET